MFENQRRWYIVQTYSGYELSVKEDLESRIKSMGMEDLIFRVVVPEEDVETVNKKGEKQIKRKRMMAGYVFVEMIVTEQSWFIVRNTPKVTGLLGSSGGGTRPVPVSPDQMTALLTYLGEIKKEEFKIKVGEKVRLVTGPWKGQIGEVSAISEEKEIVTVLLEMFGQLVPNEAYFNEVEKVENL